MEKLPAMQVLPEQNCDESPARKTNVGRVLAVVGLCPSIADIILREHGRIIARDCDTEREKQRACDSEGDVTAHKYGLGQGMMIRQSESWLGPPPCTRKRSRGSRMLHVLWIMHRMDIQSHLR